MFRQPIPGRLKNLRSKKCYGYVGLKASSIRGRSKVGQRPDSQPSDMVGPGYAGAMRDDIRLSWKECDHSSLHYSLISYWDTEDERYGKITGYSILLYSFLIPHISSDILSALSLLSPPPRPGSSRSHLRPSHCGHHRILCHPPGSQWWPGRCWR